SPRTCPMDSAPARRSSWMVTMADDRFGLRQGGSGGSVELVAALADLGDRLAYPPDPGPAFGPALVAAIARAAEAKPKASLRLAPGRRLRAAGVPAGSRMPVRRAFVLAVALVLLLAAAAAAATFTVRGIRLIFGPLPAPVPTGSATQPARPSTRPAAGPLGS